MTALSYSILCLAYIAGLLCAGIPWKVGGLPLGGFGLLILSAIVAKLWPRQWRGTVKPRIFLFAGIIALVSSFYLWARIPQPGLNDISHLIANPSQEFTEQNVTVLGDVISTPRLTRSQRIQFWLNARQVNELTHNGGSNSTNQAVTGKVYVTVPLLQGTGIQPNQALEVSGILYQPKTATNPGGFDFQAYLAQEGGFAGLKGKQVNNPADIPAPRWSWWRLQQRILRSQVRWLGSPEGPLVSAMVLGSRVVDLPYDIRDLFAKAGLAHALAASGFQVSLILGVLLALTRQRSRRVQFSVGTLALLLFLGLTGIQPSVVRAVIMGMAVLLGLLLERQTKPLGALLVAATLMLLFNPLWIWDLGFQFSFLATLGLLITVPILLKRMTGLPPTIASLIAVPLGAYLWTLPLQLYAFSIVSPYSIPVNILTTPFISIISLGGFISAFGAAIWPLAGSFLAWLLYYPTHALIALVNFCNKLPGNTIAVGTISLWQLVTLYILLILVSWHSTSTPRRKQTRSSKSAKPAAPYFGLASLALGIALVVIPVWWTQSHRFQLTVLATSGDPVLLAEDRGRITLFNSGNESTANWTLLPLFKHRGINQIDWAVAAGHHAEIHRGWLTILEQVPIKTLYASPLNQATPNDNEDPSLTTDVIQQALQNHRGQFESLTLNQAIQIGSIAINLLNQNPLVIDLQMPQQRWLYLGSAQASEQQALAQSGRLPQAKVLWWTGEALSQEILTAIRPEVAIASARSVEAATRQLLKEQKTQLYWTGQSGALTWQSQRGFEATIDAEDSSPAL